MEILRFDNNLFPLYHDLHMKIYTRTGDKGETSLYSGERVLKSDFRIEALGTVDETNCEIGRALSVLPQESSLEEVRRQLETIQHALFDLGAAIATPRTTSSEKKLEKTRFDQESTTLLEGWMDEMDKHLPPLRAFILPGGHPAGAMLHSARAICRRAERVILQLYTERDVNDNVLTYINRLSDYLFMCSRQVNAILKSPEITWISRG